MIDFPETLPAGPISEVLPEIFFVSGQMSSGSGEEQMNYSRNMTIVRDGDHLTILNSVRLGDEGLRNLDALGTVRHIVRLGFNHGRDDAFYLDRYDANFWALPGMELNRGERMHRELVAGEAGPCTGSTVFAFKTTQQPEGILRLERHGGVLISCDSLQNLSGPNEFFNERATQVMEKSGFFKLANIGPGWMHKAQPKPDDFARLKKFSYRHLFSGHGDPCLDYADEQFSATFARIMGV